MNSIGRGLARIGLAALRGTGLPRVLAPVTGGRGVILQLHRIRPRGARSFRPNAAFEITPEFLAKVVGRLRRHRIDIVDLAEAQRRTENRERSRRFAVLTVDDGYVDTFEHAYPVLKSLACPFTVFLATGMIDRAVAPWWCVLEEVIARQEMIAVSIDGPVSYYNCRSAAAKQAAFEELRGWLLDLDEDRRSQAMDELAWRYGIDSKAVVEACMMNWEQVRTLARDPLVSLGSLTTEYHYLAKRSESQVRAEIRDGARVLESATGVGSRYFAYPYGSAAAAGPREYRIVQESGFEIGLTTIPGVIRARHARQTAAWRRIAMNGRFQTLGYLDWVVSGLPFLFKRGPRSVPATAAASSESAGPPE